jgi:hypothetical protein
VMTTILGGEPALRRAQLASALVRTGRDAVTAWRAGMLTCPNMERIAEREISKGRWPRGSWPDWRSAWGRHAAQQAVSTCRHDLNGDPSRPGTSAWTGSLTPQPVDFAPINGGDTPARLAAAMGGIRAVER